MVPGIVENNELERTKTIAVHHKLLITTTDGSLTPSTRCFSLYHKTSLSPRNQFGVCFEITSKVVTEHYFALEDDYNDKVRTICKCVTYWKVVYISNISYLLVWFKRFNIALPSKRLCEVFIFNLITTLLAVSGACTAMVSFHATKPSRHLFPGIMVVFRSRGAI